MLIAFRFCSVNVELPKATLVCVHRNDVVQ